MSYEASIHPAQTRILRELLFLPHAGYAELQKPTGLTSDHFNFHISRLAEMEFIEKVARGRYRLTAKGKEYANRLDTDQNTIERQPKVAVLLAVTKDIDGRPHYILQERLKQPYYGYHGFPTGKVRWGETILEAAARELVEETNLKADLDYMGIYHEHAHRSSDRTLLEDKIFFVVRCTNPRGEMLDRFEGGANYWMTRKQAEKLEKVFGSIHIEFDVGEGTRRFVEEDDFYDDKDF